MKLSVFIDHFRGCMRPSSGYLDESIKAYENEILSLNIPSIKDDKANMASDVRNIRDDFKKALLSYKLLSSL